MQIFNTRDELEAAIGTDTYGSIAIIKKDDAAKLHAGHESLVAYSKSNFDKTVVTFWEVLSTVHYVYKVAYLEDTYDQPWDSTGCLNWCEVQGVDYVLLPDPGYSEVYLESKGVFIDGTSTMIFDWVDQIWQENNYPEYEPTEMDASKYTTTLKTKTCIILQYNKAPLNMNYVQTWKDGESIFIAADYVNSYMPDNDAYIVLDPIKNADGIYYSNRSSSYSQAQIDLLLQIDGVVNSVGYSDTTALIVALNDLNTGAENFDVYRIDVTIGGVAGDVNDFINVLFTIEGNTDSWPIYKKGVR